MQPTTPTQPQRATTGYNAKALLELTDETNQQGVVYYLNHQREEVVQIMPDSYCGILEVVGR